MTGSGPRWLRMGRVNSSGGHGTAPAGFRRGPRSASGEGQPPILKTLVPHFGQVPESACLPFFIVTIFGFWTSTFILSLTQYAIVMGSGPPRAPGAPRA